MTGPVERVPLTDEQLDEWERMAARSDQLTGGCLWWPTAMTHLIAELRASRAREQELQQRIEDGLTVVRAGFEAADGITSVDFLIQSMLGRVRAALTGTEEETNG